MGTERRGRRDALDSGGASRDTAHLRRRPRPRSRCRRQPGGRKSVTIYLVRHAKAGVRDSWPGDDEHRPLSGRGRLQAFGLLELLRDKQFGSVLSSPYVRCIETVGPLAAERRMAIEPVEALAEGASLSEVIALVRKHAAQGAVM